jgi:competence protein ComEC
LPLSTLAVDQHAAAALGVWGVLVAALALALRRAGRRAPGRRSARRARTRAVAIALAVSAAAAAAAHAQRGAPPPPPGVLRITFLDVGQGDATLIELDGTAVLVDTGVPEGPILSRLQEAGVERLDALMLTHAEHDHEGAAPQVIERYRPALVVDGGAGWPSPIQRALAAGRTRVHAPQQGETITLGRLTFRVLWPPRRPPGWRATGDPNDHALVTRLEAEGVSALLTADAESHVLLPLRPQSADILKVSHHGSADDGLPTLLAQIRPRLAAIEVGAENPYGHPAPSTLKALADAGVGVIRTDVDGTTAIHADDGRVTRP